MALDPEALEAVTNFLWEFGAVGVVEEIAPESTEAVGLRAFFSASTEMDLARRALHNYLDSLRALGISVGPGAVEAAPVEDRDWGEAWRQFFRPVRVGRWWILPPWESVEAKPGELPLVIEPGRAFGTGTHPTTQGCLTLLDQFFLEGHRVHRALDIGTGSGILAIAAAQLGALHVDAVDPDPDAVAAAQANGARNGVTDRVDIRLGSATDVIQGTYPLILANLLGQAHRDLAPAYRRWLLPGGWLILGGILVEEEPTLTPVFTGQGLTVHRRWSQNGWISLAVTLER